MRRFFPLSLLATIVAGCHAPPRIDAQQAILSATATSQAIAFNVEGEPTDVEATQSDALSMSDAVQASLTHDPRVQAALARVRIALAEAKQTRLLPNPVLSVAFRFPEGGGTVNVDAGLTADLVSLLGRPGKISAADHRLRAASAEAVDVALDVVAEVQQSYVEAQSADALAGVLDGQIKLNARLVQLAKDRLNVGESGRLDVLTLDAERVELETESIQRRAEARDKRIALARLLGRPSGEVAWKLAPFDSTPTWSGDERAWVAAALESRPDLQAKQWELAALGDEAALAKFAILDGGEIGADAERDDGKWSVGPAVSAPIAVFDWGQSRKAKVTAQQIEARHRAIETRRRVVEDVRRAVAKLIAAESALAKARSELLPLQQQRHEQAEAAYKSGAADVTALLVAEQGLEGSRAKLVELQTEAALARVRLHRAVGGSGAAPTPATQPSTSTNAGQP